MDRTQKKELVDSLHGLIKNAGVVVVTKQAGLTVAEVTELRRNMRSAGASFKVSKNRLTRRALDGTKYAHLGASLKGPTAIAYSTDPVAAAKVAVAYAAKNEKLTIVAGGLGERALDVAAVKALATLPSLPEMRAKFLGLLNAPATRLATVLGAPAAQVARVIAAHAKKQDAA